MKDLLLLHGALGSSEQFAPLENLLRGNFKTHPLNFSGHGRRPSHHHAFTIQNCAHEVLDWMNERQLQQTDIFGYSMGGYVALWLARFYPQRVGRIVTLGTKLHWNEAEAERETKMLQPEKVELKVPAFAQALAALHGEHEWKSVMMKTASLMRDLAHSHLRDEDFRIVQNQVLLLRGTNDVMVTHEETARVASLLSKAQHKELDAQPHPLEKTETAVIAQQLRAFFD